MNCKLNFMSRTLEQIVIIFINLSRIYVRFQQEASVSKEIDIGINKKFYYLKNMNYKLAILLKFWALYFKALNLQGLKCKILFLSQQLTWHGLLLQFQEAAFSTLLIEMELAYHFIAPCKMANKIVFIFYIVMLSIFILNLLAIAQAATVDDKP